MLRDVGVVCVMWRSRHSAPRGALSRATVRATNAPAVADCTAHTDFAACQPSLNRHFFIVLQIPQFAGDFVLRDAKQFAGGGTVAVLLP